MKKIFIFALLVISFAACNSTKDESVADFFSSSSTEPTSPGVTVDPVISNTFMYLTHKIVSGSPRYTHKTTATGKWTETCKVDLNDSNFANRDITCVTESTELDLMSLGLDLEYNVPNHVSCPYVITMAPYFFRYPAPLIGTASVPPNYIVVTKDSSAATHKFEVKGYTDKTKATDNNNLQIKDASYKCAYDYTDDKGPNCCPGTYTEELHEISEAGVEKVTTSTKTWGGDVTNCLDGPATVLNKSDDPSNKWPIYKYWRIKDQETSILSSDDFLNKNNLDPKQIKFFNKNSAPLLSNLNFKINGFQNPIELMTDFKTSTTETGSGSNPVYGTLSISSLMNQKLVTTRFLATYAKGTDLKAFNDILTYYDESKFKSIFGDPSYYTIICADDANEVKARIKLRVREWNTLSNLSKGLEPTADEDNVIGDEEDLPDSPNNDYYDWDDSPNLKSWDYWEDTDADGTKDLPTYPGRVL
jgi:hypothetical protein